MTIRSLILISMLALSLMGCDQTDNMSKSKTRTMVIGGMPVHDRDYLLLADQINVKDQQTTFLPVDR